MELDLLVVRLKAHMHYLYPRIQNIKHLNEFCDTMNDIMKTINTYQKPIHPDSKFINQVKCKYGYATKAIDIYKELYYIHTKRFLEGRSENFYLEKV